MMLILSVQLLCKVVNKDLVHMWRCWWMRGSWKCGTAGINGWGQE